jgi:hypothetical protein
MKNFQKITFLLILLYFVSSCEMKQTEFEFEKSVMTEIFPSLVDSICVDSRKMLPPPMLGDFVEDKTGHVSIDSTKATKEQRIEYRKWQKSREEVEKDTSSIIIAFDPFLKEPVFNFNKELKKKYSFLEVSIVNNDTIKGYKFDFEKIKLNNKFKIKNISEFPKTFNFNLLYELKYDFVFSGILQLSRIQFDKQKQFGILEGSFSFCGKCGRGFNIFIKKVNNKWVIDKVEGTWVS